MQNMAEWLIDLAVVEPYRVLPNRSTWVGDMDGLVDVVSAGGHRSLLLSCLERGRGFVVTQWGETLVVGVYFSPNSSRAELEEFLGEVETVIRRHLPRPMLVVGDLNAKSGAWDSPVTNAKGADVEEWVEGSFEQRLRPYMRAV
jgi:endonuclease/exonuclease/phosphatase (EEP) superfamily protein YafD